MRVRERRVYSIRTYFWNRRCKFGEWPSLELDEIRGKSLVEGSGAIMGRVKGPPELNHSDLSKLVAEPTGQSSQLFPVATGRNAQFLATVARNALNPAFYLIVRRSWSNLRSVES